jgi:hypothetical protein
LVVTSEVRKCGLVLGKKKVQRDGSKARLVLRRRGLVEVEPKVQVNISKRVVKLVGPGKGIKVKVNIHRLPSVLVLIILVLLLTCYVVRPHILMLAASSCEPRETVILGMMLIETRVWNAGV